MPLSAKPPEINTVLVHRPAGDRALRQRFATANVVLIEADHLAELATVQRIGASPRARARGVLVV